MRWYQKAADQGRLDAVLKVAALYWFTNPKFENWSLARELLEKAYFGGYASDAGFYLGEIYSHGLAVLPDGYKASSYYSTSAKAGDARSQKALAVLEAQKIRALSEIDTLSLPVALSRLRADLNRWSAVEYTRTEVTDYGRTLGKSVTRHELSLMPATGDRCLLLAHLEISVDGSVQHSDDFQFDLANESGSTVKTYSDWEHEAADEQFRKLAREVGMEKEADEFAAANRAAADSGGGVGIRIDPDLFVLQIDDLNSKDRTPTLFFSNKDGVDMVRAELNRVMLLCHNEGKSSSNSTAAPPK